MQCPGLFDVQLRERERERERGRAKTENTQYKKTIIKSETDTQISTLKSKA